MLSLALPPLPYAGLLARRPAQPTPPPEPRVTAAHVAEVLAAPVWALRPTDAALLADLPALVGLTVSQARAALGLAPRAAASGRAQPAGAVAVLPILGMLWPRGALADLLGLPTAARLAQHFRALVSDPDVSAIVLDVYSPGGVVEGLPELADEIYQARGRKRLVAVANYLAASGAYWLASAAGELVVPPSGEVGSIGVYALHEDYSRALEQEGVRVTLVHAGERKVDGNPYQPLSDRARADLQARVDEVYGQFTRDVARGRGVRVEAVRSGFGQGRIVGARDAVRLGMADRVATLEAVIGELLQGQPAGARAAAGPLAANTDMRRRRMRLRALAGNTGGKHGELLRAEVSADTIPGHIRLRAQAALTYCRADLVLPALALRWFRASQRPNSLGVYLPEQPDELWLADDQRGADVAETVAHEARHAWQEKSYPADHYYLADTREGAAWRETDAARYAARVVSAIR